MAGYGYDNPYNTSYGAQGGADGGGFMAGEVTSSPAGGKVKTLSVPISGLDTDLAAIGIE